MLAIHRVRAAWRRAPRVSAIGIVVMIVAGATDVTVHLATDGHHATGPMAHAAHLLGIAGMVLVLVGLIAFGTRHRHGRRTGPSMEAPRDAHR